MNESIKNKLVRFFCDYKAKEFKRNEIIIQPYDQPKGIYFIEKGNVKMYFISKDGNEIILNTFKPFAFFPMSWALNNDENKYFFEPTSPTIIRIAPKDEVIEFVKSNPDIILDLLKRVYKGTDGLLTRSAYLMTGNAHSRLITELIIESKRFGKKNGNEIQINTSEKELASKTGLSRETISREIKKLKDKNLIYYEKKALTIQDLHKLEQEIV